MSDVEDELRREIAALRQQLAAAQEIRGRGEAEPAAEPAVEPASHATLVGAVFDGTLDALLLADDEGVYVHANPAACELLGTPRNELIGRRVMDFAPPTYETEKSYRAFLESGRMRGQLELRRTDGTSRIVDFNAVANVAPGLHLSSLRDVTEHVAAEAALRQSELRFRAMVEKARDGIALLGADARLLYQSPAVGRVLGIHLEDGEPIPWSDVLDDDERPKLTGALAKLDAGPGAVAHLELRLRRRDGSPGMVELTATNRLDDPSIQAIVVNMRDLTARRALEAQREGFMVLSLDLLSIGGTDGRFRWLNPAWETTLGWSLDELCARPCLDFVHPDDRAPTAHEEGELGEGSVISSFENRYRCKDGTYRRLKWSAVRSADGLVYASARDVTDERASAQRDRLLFSASPLPMLLVDAHSLRVLDANDASIRTYGYSRDELLSLTVDDIVVEEQRPSLHRGVDELAEGAKAVFVSDRLHQTRSGERRRVQVTSHRITVDGRDAILKVIVDVTEARRLEEERARVVERLRLLELSVSRLNDIVLITSATPLSEPGPTIVYANEAFERITGYTREEALGKTPRMLQGPDTDRAALARMRAAFELAVPVREEIVNYTKSGVPYWLEIDVAPVRDDAGVLTHFVAIERDITERHRASEALRVSQERLRQAQKMEAVGNLAGGIAHDFNNLLSVILSYTSLGMEGLPPADSLRQDLEEIHRAGLRAADLTRQLLAFSRQQILQPSVIDVSAVVRGIEKMLGRLLGEDVDLAIHTTAEAGRAFVDPGQLEQVIMNLVVNARDAMPDGGSITIETTCVALDDAYAAVHPGVKPGSYVLLAVTDSGVGMDRSTQDQIFEPFFTTKEKSKGTGLGLSTVYGIVKQSEGHIWVYSEPGLGTTFKVYLPRTDRLEDALAVPSAAADSLRGAETILLVEDETPVRHVVRSILRRNGYHVLEAQNAGEALLVCEQFKATIHLLLTDVVMPRMSGKLLAERLAGLRPEMKTLFMSGYTENTIVHHGVLDAGVEFLPKPILPHALLEKLRQVLDGASRRSRPGR